MASLSPENETTTETEVVEENTPAENEETVAAEASADPAPVESEEVAETVAEAAPAQTAPSNPSFADVKAKMALNGVVKSTELQGAIIDLGMEHNGLLHISQLSEKPVKNVTDVIKEGDSITVYVLAVDHKRGRIDLSLMQPPAVTWNEIKVGQTLEGTVARIEDYGVFVDFGAERPGLIHVSELAKGYVNSPSDIVKVGDSIEAKVIGVNKRKKQIDLSVRAMEVEEAVTIEADEDEEEVATAMEIALRKAMEASGGSMTLSKKQKKRDKNRSRKEQDDIIARTLKWNQE